MEIKILEKARKSKRWKWKILLYFCTGRLCSESLFASSPCPHPPPLPLTPTILPISPPPHLPVAALVVAVEAARAHATFLPKPILHLSIALATSDTSSALFFLFAKGVDVFLQMKFQYPSIHKLSLVTHELVAKILPFSHADNVAIVAKRNLHSPTIQLRLYPYLSAALDVPFHMLRDVVLHNWTTQIQKILGPPHSCALAAKYNVFTTLHLHLFLTRQLNFLVFATLARDNSATTILLNDVRRVSSHLHLYSVTRRLSQPHRFFTTQHQPHPQSFLHGNRVPSSEDSSEPTMVPPLPDLLDQAIDRAIHATFHSTLALFQNYMSSHSDFTYRWLRKSHRFSSRLLYL